MPECFALLRRRLEAGDPRSGTRSYIRVLRLLEKFSLAQLSAAVEYALDIDVIDPDSFGTIVEHRAEQPAELFRLDGRPHLAHVWGRSLFQLEKPDLPIPLPHGN